MIRKLMLAVLVLPLVAGTLGGCVVYTGGGYYGHPYYWHDRW